MPNKKIFSFLLQKLDESFGLMKYAGIQGTFTDATVLKELPWTPKRWEKFCDALNAEFDLSINYDGTIANIVDDIDFKYKSRFWGGGIWQPRTDEFSYTGWALVDEVMKHNPQKVLDVGCGYNQFKQRIPNLVGIDKYNNCADYMVGIMEYKVDPGTYDAVLVLGSINFGEFRDVSEQMAKVFELTAPGGRVYLRANTGKHHKLGPYVDMYFWDFETAYKIAKENSVDLLTLKQDTDSRIFMVYKK